MILIFTVCLAQYIVYNILRDCMRFLYNFDFIWIYSFQVLVLQSNLLILNHIQVVDGDTHLSVVKSLKKNFFLIVFVATKLDLKPSTTSFSVGSIDCLSPLLLEM